MNSNILFVLYVYNIYIYVYSKTWIFTLWDNKCLLLNETPCVLYRYYINIKYNYQESELDSYCTESKVKNSENNYEQFLSLIIPKLWLD